MFSKFFIERPVFATVISIVIVLLGALAIPKLPIEKTPNITPPTVGVQAYYPGADAKTIAETVATPLEEQINGVDNMLYMSSKSSNDGSMSLTVTFEVGTDIDMASVLVQNRVSQAQAMLPEDVVRQGVTVKKQSTGFVMMVNVVSPSETFDRVYISNYINIRLKDTLTRVPGVGEVRIFGAQDFSMRIWLDPEKLKSRNLTVLDVISAIREQNVQVAAGQIGAQPALAGQQFEYTVNTQGRLKTPEEFGAIILRSMEGRLLRLGDVARIELGAQNYSQFSWVNGKPTVGIAIIQLPGANSLDISRAVHQKMGELSKSFPADLKYEILYDTTRFISASLEEVILTLLFTVVLVILTVFVFLEDFRATLIPSITIPVSLIGTFAVMLMTDMSINILTLFGLVLVIGIVVDDSIIVVENVMRIIHEENLPVKEATVKAMEQISGPVIATTLVLLAVFVPTSLIGGVSGRLYTQFAMTISIAMLFSALNALTLSPALCGILLKPIDEEKRGWFARRFNTLFKSTRQGYMKVVQTILRKTFFVMIGFAALAAIAGFGMKEIPAGFLPDEDEGTMFMQVKLPDGASTERTRAVMLRVNDILTNTPGINSYITIGGFSLMDGIASSNAGTYFIILDPWGERKTRALQIEQILQNVQGKLFSIQDAFCIVFRPPPIMGLGFAGGFEIQVQDRAGLGFDELQKAGDALVFQGYTDSVITRVNSTFRANVPQLYVNIDRIKAKTLNVPLDTIFSTLQTCLGGMYVNDFNLFGRTFKVNAQADAAFRNNADDILQLEVRNASGQMLPLRTLATIRDSSGPQSVTHFNLYPCATVSGIAKPGYSTGQAIERVRQMCREKLPTGMDYEWSGISYQQLEAGNKALFIFFMASAFVFLFLAAQYESWSIPIAIVLTIPIALFGAIGLTWLRHYDNNIYTQIGLVLLIGLASKTAILLVEFAKQHREQGHGIIESATTAARIRFRPILMTSLAFVLGVIPLVFATGAGAVARRALGTAVFGGMLAATVIGVFMMPVFYVVVQTLTEKIKKKRTTGFESNKKGV
jgi:HAE1 family hydrophobic/amphiphilic exporter-1